MINRCGIRCTTLHLFVISLIVTWSIEQVTTKMELYMRMSMAHIGVWRGY